MPMSFWKDPQYSSVRVLIIIVLVIIAGYFAYKYENMSGQDTGRVINITSPSVTVNPAGQLAYQCTGSAGSGTSCTLDSNCGAGGSTTGTIDSAGKCCNGNGICTTAPMSRTNIGTTTNTSSTAHALSNTVTQ